MEKLITIATYDYLHEAEAAKLFLESYGIQVFLENRNIVGIYWAVSNAVGGVKLHVVKSDAERAADIIHQIQAPNASDNENETDASIQFNCTECGKSISFPAARRGHVEDCPHCGEYVDVPEISESAP